MLSDTMQATFLMMLADLDPLMPILLLATSDTSMHKLPLEVRFCVAVIPYHFFLHVACYLAILS